MPDRLNPSPKMLKGQLAYSIYTLWKILCNSVKEGIMKQLNAIWGHLKVKKKYLISGMKSEEYTVVNIKWMCGWKTLQRCSINIIFFINLHRPEHNIMYCVINIALALNQYLLTLRENFIGHSLTTVINIHSYIANLIELFLRNNSVFFFRSAAVKESWKRLWHTCSSSKPFGLIKKLLQSLFLEGSAL